MIYTLPNDPSIYLSHDGRFFVRIDRWTFTNAIRETTSAKQLHVWKRRANNSTTNSRRQQQMANSSKIPITLDRVTAAVEQDDNIGFCTSCGEEAYGVEPDARRYECELCGAKAVYGAEELLIRMVA